MKKLIILSLFSLAFGQLLQAQDDTLANRGFEYWQEIASQKKEDPVNWRSINVLLPDSNERGIRKSTDAYEGNYSLELFPVLPEQGKDSALTVVCLGSPVLKTGMKETDYRTVSGLPFIHFGSKIKLQGYYKFLPNEGTIDTAYVKVYLKNSDMLGSNNIMAGGRIGLSPSPEWQPFVVQTGSAIVQGSDGVADSLVVLFFYKSNNKLANATGRLLIDDLSLDFSTEVVEIKAGNEIMISPNPANANFTFYQSGNAISKIVILNVLGGVMKEVQLTSGQNQTIIDSSTLSPGLYQIQCLDGKGNIFETKSLVID